MLLSTQIQKLCDLPCCLACLACLYLVCLSETDIRGSTIAALVFFFAMAALFCCLYGRARPQACWCCEHETGLAAKIERLRRCHLPVTLYSVLMVLSCWGR